MFHPIKDYLNLPVGQKGNLIRRHIDAVAWLIGNKRTGGNGALFLRRHCPDQVQRYNLSQYSSHRLAIANEGMPIDDSI